MPAPVVTEMNEEQRQTWEMLLSQIDCLEYQFCPEDNGAMVFDGEGVDGPCVGYIELDGKVTWLAGG